MNKAIIGLVILMMAITPFSILLIDSTDAGYTPTIDVFMIAGQSNGAYSNRAIPSEADPICSPGVAYYYGTEVKPVPYSEWSDTETYGIYDMVNADHTAHIGGIELPFAATYHKLTGHKICIINVAIGGAKIIEWYPGTEYYTWAQKVFNLAITDLESKFNVDVKGLIWIQGESDPTWQIQAYKNRFMTMFNTMTHAPTASSYFNEDYAFENCIISLARQHRGQNSCIAQIQLDAEQNCVKLGCIVCDTFTYENGLLYGDDTHYTQKGRNIVATDLATNYVRIFN